MPKQLPSPSQALKTRIEGFEADLKRLEREKVAVQQKASDLQRSQAQETRQLHQETQRKERALQDLENRRFGAKGEERAKLDEQITKTKKELDTLRDRKIELDNAVQGPVRDKQDQIDAVKHELAKARFPFARNPRDVAVSGKEPPAALPLAGRDVGGTPNQTAQMQADVKWAQAQGATDIRINQAQVDAAKPGSGRSTGFQQGENRPDLQFTLGGQRYYIEYEQPSNPRGAGHVRDIIRNDPSGKVIVKLVPTTPGFTPGKPLEGQTFDLDAAVKLVE